MEVANCTSWVGADGTAERLGARCGTIVTDDPSSPAPFELKNWDGAAMSPATPWSSGGDADWATTDRVHTQGSAATGSSSCTRVSAKAVRWISRPAMASRQEREAYRPKVGSCVEILSDDGEGLKGVAGQIIVDDMGQVESFLVRN